MQRATAIQQAGLNNLIEELVNFSERQPDSVVSEKSVLEARRAAFAVTSIGIIVVAVFVKWMRVTVSPCRPSAALGRPPTLFPSQKGWARLTVRPLSLHLKKPCINRGFGGSN
jgi:hypothetical protein